jgi:hypothetical protein
MVGFHRPDQKPNSQEHIRSVGNMLVLDADGTISDPWEKTVELGILNHILQRLERNEAVAFNTGRSLDWVIEMVSGNMSNAIVVAEKKESLEPYPFETLRTQSKFTKGNLVFLDGLS